MNPMSEEGQWVEREPEDIPEPAKPKKAKLVKAKIVDETPPHSEEAENGILSVFLQNNEYMGHFAIARGMDWFFSPGPRYDLAMEMFQMHEKGLPVELVGLTQRLIDKGVLDKFGGAGKLTEIYNFVPCPTHYQQYCNILKEKYLLRNLLKRADVIKEACHISAHDVTEVGRVAVEEASQMISLFQETEKEKSFEDYLQETVSFWQDTKDHKIKSSIPSPWKCWNYELGGVKKGYALLMGPRKSGKSSLAKDLALNAALNHGKRTDYYSYEMSEMSIIMRMVADLSGQDSRMIFSPDLFPPERDQEKRIAQAFSRLASAPIRITHNPGKDVDWISYRCKKWGSELVIVDYLQLLPKPTGLDPKAGYEREVSENSRRLQVLCGEMNNSLFVLGQLNKDGESRWSSGPENDIDLCLRIEDGGILVKSQRNGPSGMTMPLVFNPASFRFEEAEEIFPS